MQEEEQMEALTEPPAYDEAGFVLTEEELALRSLTAKLEPEQRELVLLRFGQQLKLREIAQITGGGIGLSNALLYRLYNFDFFLLGEHAWFQADVLLVLAVVKIPLFLALAAWGCRRKVRR